MFCIFAAQSSDDFLSSRWALGGWWIELIPDQRSIASLSSPGTSRLKHGSCQQQQHCTCSNRQVANQQGSKDARQALRCGYVRTTAFITPLALAAEHPPHHHHHHHGHHTAPKANQRGDSSQQPAVFKEKERASAPRAKARSRPGGRDFPLPPPTDREEVAPDAMSSSSSSSSMGGSLALAAATAVAFSGSLVIFSLCRAHLSHPADDDASAGPLRPCLSSSGKQARTSPPRSAPPLWALTDRRQLACLLLLFLLRTGGISDALVKSKAEKRVRFAADVVDNEGAPRPTRSSPAAAAAGTCRGAAAESSSPEEATMMPANREALYRGMLRDRSAHRVTCSY
ncbi:hypothetical protein HU200_006261 [Digitaria exilis]|uniref:Uncharacterized protein n=1 Tax=Digitaria exilis TaxID=1010633 RepID=A0A835FSD9_9POAL|nr:hypothetical protein HU200_006261 [Digitaria exilis]